MPLPAAPTTLDRVLQAFRALVRAELPRLTFLGLYAYVVTAVSPNGTTADVRPADTSLVLPTVPAVPLVSSNAGEVATLSVGAAVLVRFVNGDPTMPVIVGAAGVPQAATVDCTGAMALGPSAASVTIAGGTSQVARVGDVVTVAFPPNMLVAGALGVAPASPAIPFTGLLAMPAPGFGIIQTGQPKLSA